MNILETQVAKINISDIKTSNNYIHLTAEKISTSDAELFIVSELPLLNPAASNECRNICEAIASSLKRSLNIIPDNTTFESALADLNAELSKLVSLGKTHWANKLNVAIAVKIKNTLYVSSVGNVNALIIRNNTIGSINDTTKNIDLYKIFSSFTIGTVREDDIFILSNSELLENISLERLQNYLENAPLTESIAKIIQNLKENVRPEGSIGTIIGQQQYPNYESLDREITSVNEQALSVLPNEGVYQYLLQKGIKHAKFFTSKMVHSIRNFNIKRVTDFASGSMKTKIITERLSKVPNKFYNSIKSAEISRSKKLFAASALVLLIVIIASIVVSKSIGNSSSQGAVDPKEIQSLQKISEDINASIVFGDTVHANNKLSELLQKINSLSEASKSTKEIRSLQDEIQTYQNKLNKSVSSNFSKTATLSNGQVLIYTDNHLMTESGQTITSYGLKSKQTSTENYSINTNIKSQVTIGKNKLLIHNGQNLNIWNPVSGEVHKVSSQIPNIDNITGMAYYPTNNKLYILDNTTGSITNYSILEKDISIGKQSLQDDRLKQSYGMSIDSNIYVLLSNSVVKFNSGTQVSDFSTNLTSTFDRKSKLLTSANLANLYIFNPTKSEIIILNKNTGQIIKTLNGGEINNALDFVVDEQINKLYILKDNIVYESSL